MFLGHGGNIETALDTLKIPEKGILDFSSNINPLGMPPGIKNIILKNLSLVSRYPDCQCRSLKEFLSDYLGIGRNNILVGNGSNELIHLIPRVIKPRNALIYQPAFSEYELSLKLCGAKPFFLFAREKEDFRVDIKMILKYLPKMDLIMLCNPNNPTGSLLEKGPLLDLVRSCLKHKTFLLIDEAFIEFIENHDKISLLKEAGVYKYLLVLRSLTKFFSLPGLRIGYLAADKEFIKRISLFQPTWSVNAFAQAVAGKNLLNPEFISSSRSYIKKEKEFLFKQLIKIEGIQPWYPNANFIFCKILDRRKDVKFLARRLLDFRILIRDCSNYRGLNKYFFRVAVRKRKDNKYLISSLKRIFN